VGGERVALGAPQDGGWIAAESLNALLLLLESGCLASVTDLALATIRFLVVDKAGWTKAASTSSSSTPVTSFNIARLDVGDGDAVGIQVRERFALIRAVSLVLGWAAGLVLAGLSSIGVCRFRLRGALDVVEEVKEVAGEFVLDR